MNFPLLQNQKLAFRGKKISVITGQIAGKEKQTEREVVVHPGAVIILPIYDKEHVIMIRNERFAVNETLWELPAGTLEPNEAPHQTAMRELIEETGYQTERVTPLLSFYTTPGFCNEIMHSYLAENLKFVGQQLEDNEKIQVEVLSWEKIRKMINEGTIKDGKTIATLLFYLYRV